MYLCAATHLQTCALKCESEESLGQFTMKLHLSETRMQLTYVTSVLQYRDAQHEGGDSEGCRKRMYLLDRK